MAKLSESFPITRVTEPKSCSNLDLSIKNQHLLKTQSTAFNFYPIFNDKTISKKSVTQQLAYYPHWPPTAAEHRSKKIIPFKLSNNFNEVSDTRPFVGMEKEM